MCQALLQQIWRLHLKSGIGTAQTSRLNTAGQGSSALSMPADLDGDGSTQLITGGTVTNSTGSYPSLRIWSYDGEVMGLKDSHEGIGASSIFFSDLNKDGKPEILMVSRVLSGTSYSAQLCVWQWNGDPYCFTEYHRLGLC